MTIFASNTYDPATTPQAADSQAFQHAIRLADATDDDNLLVFPVHTVDQNGHCTCRAGQSCTNPGKHPITSRAKWGPALNRTPYDASNDEAKLLKWAKKYPGSNYGIAPKHNQVGLDPENYRSLKFLADLAGITPEQLLASTYSARTGGGGYHLIFRTTAQYKGSLTRPIKTDVKGRAIAFDVKGHGGFLVAPGSRSNKGRYELINAGPITLVPDGMHAALAEANCLVSGKPHAGIKSKLAKAKAAGIKLPPVKITAKTIQVHGNTPPGYTSRQVRSHTWNSVHAYPILGNDRNSKMVGLVCNLMGAGHTAEFTRCVGRGWLVNQVSNFATPLPQAFACLDAEIRRTLARIDSGDFLVQSEDDYLVLANAKVIDEGKLLSRLRECHAHGSPCQCSNPSLGDARLPVGGEGPDRGTKKRLPGPGSSGLVCGVCGGERPDRGTKKRLPGPGTGKRPFGVITAEEFALARAVLKLVVYKIEETGDDKVLATNKQFQKLSGLDESQFKRKRRLFVSEVNADGSVSRATLAELLFREFEDKGCKDASTKGRGVPSKYSLGRDAAAFLVESDEVDPAEALACAEECLEAQERAWEEWTATRPFEPEESDGRQEKAKDEPVVVAVPPKPVRKVLRVDRPAPAAWSVEAVFKPTGDPRRDALSWELLFGRPTPKPRR